MPQEAFDTAEFLLFMDKVFDSTNGSDLLPKSGKLLRTAVSNTTPHVQFWKEAIKVFESMSCSRPNRRHYVPPTFKNWVHTLKGFSYLWQKVQNVGFKFLCTRNFNQDPLENFFGALRSHGSRNVNPDCHSFRNSFKALIINNYVSAHSPVANCEADELLGLSTLHNFFSTKEINTWEQSVEIPMETLELTACETSSKLTYIAGYIAKKVLKSIHVCKVCRADLVGHKDQLSEDEKSFIEARKYAPNALLYPNSMFNNLFHVCIRVLATILPKVCYIANLKLVLQYYLVTYTDFSNTFNCNVHNMLTLFLNNICKFHVNIWCKNINRILKGKDKRKYKDHIKILASNKYFKMKNAALKIKKTKNLN